MKWILLSTVFDEFGTRDRNLTCETTLSEQLAHSAVDLHLKEISEFLHGSEMNKNPTLP